MKKLLLTGANGFLASRVRALYAGRFELVACGHETLDITDAEAVRALFSRERPDYVLHCAALADTGFCERNEALSEAVNVRGAENVAVAAAETGAKLVAMSSDQVYAGCRQTGPLPEEAACPANIYGRHKLAAEGRILTAAPDAVCLRLTWLYALPSPACDAHGLPALLAAAAREGRPLNAAVHEHRGLTDANALARRLSGCFFLPGGVYNFGCPNTLDSFASYRAAAQAFGLPAGRVQPDRERFLPDGRNLAMDPSALLRAGRGLTLLPDGFFGPGKSAKSANGFAFPDTAAGFALAAKEAGL